MLMKDAFAHDDDRLLVCCAFPQESLHNVPNKTLISVIAVAELLQCLGIFKKCSLRTILGIFKLKLTGTAVSFPRKNCGVRVFCLMYSGSKLSVL